jgi:hypothetical protein
MNAMKLHKFDQSALPEFGVPSDYARASHFTRQGICNAIKKGKLASRKLGNHHIIGKSDFLAWVRTLAPNSQNNENAETTQTTAAA